MANMAHARSAASQDLSNRRAATPARPRRAEAALGNQARLRRISAAPAALQAKLAIGAVNDPLEHEADAAADQVMRMPDPALGLSSAGPALSRKCSACEDKDEASRLWRKAAGAAHGADGAAAPPIVHQALRGGGQPLDPASRAFMETRFDHDFSAVRLHTDTLAQQSARAVGARAYTVGGDIVFGAGAFSPASDSGRRLIAHELAHVVQQGGGSAAARSNGAGTLQRAPVHGPQSPDFAQGYQDGAAGEPSHAIPRAGDALTEYDEGYAKGHFEFTQAASTPVAPAQAGGPPAKPAAAKGVCSASETPASVTLCNRDFAGKVAGALVPARHCFTWAHPAGENQTPATIDPKATNTYDPSNTATPDAEPNKPGTECLQTYNVDPECVKKKYAELCSTDKFNLGDYNCCSCANDALTACGAKTGPADFPKKNQGVGLPDSYGTGWKKTVLDGANWVLHNVVEQI